MTASLNHDRKMDRCYPHLQEAKNNISDLELARRFGARWSLVCFCSSFSCR